MERQEILRRANAYILQEKDERFKSEVEDLIKKEDFAELEDRFFQTLEFGTGGLRGIMGGGTNRMNTLEIKMATQGLANYVKKAFPKKDAAGKLSAVIAYDSRLNSDVFAEAAALIFAANGIKSYLFSGVRPTPELSFAIRELSADTGVVVTASHNPRMYNGYKAYWNDGGQVIEPHDALIIKEVNAVREAKEISKEEALSCGMLKIIDKEIDEKFWAMCERQLFRPHLIKEKASQAKIVYTPLHGTGAMHVEKVLGDLGLKVVTVPEQKNPDGNFPTVEKPNPEEKPAMKMAVALGKKEGASCVMATDPDADRFGTAFPDAEGNFVLVSGNQMGALLLEYVLLSKTELGTMPKDAVAIRSIVTSPFGDAVCKKFGVRLLECLTGFKWIAALQAKNESEKTGTYVFGWEESYGYKVERETMDKDGVSAAAMCAEMTLYWNSRGKSVLEHLDDMWAEYGYFEDAAISKNFEGPQGKAAMEKIMSHLRTQGLKTLGGKKVEKIRDIKEGVIFDAESPDKKTPLDFPKSNVLQFFLEGGTIVSCRPSGTEPKIKFYINACLPPAGTADLSSCKKEAAALIEAISSEIDSILNDASN